MSAATPAPTAAPSPEEVALEARRATFREQLALQQTQIREQEKSLKENRAARKRAIIAATRPIDEHNRDGLLSYEEIAPILGVSKSAVYKMARGGWKAPGLRAQGV